MFVCYFAIFTQIIEVFIHMIFYLTQSDLNPFKICLIGQRLTLKIKNPISIASFLKSPSLGKGGGG